ncbi:sulfurtransferase TusA family protein [Aneurinibacillus uraniidurans]|uniref:sulfurtransferase TusA family protein n=1 Tax=Aneurinibacillus uraniidurans TaxID=2966586 RepID=UPI00234BA20A|nr:sulfurtransferase TusA family protein [Aneurinibacillus sp. B1]WCN39461.1 sulfurtransferase TusA family protein [Aneurinibacillus sp. B1]
MNADVKVDAKGLSCPMPIVRAKKAMDMLESGQILELETTDKGSMNDFRGWVKQTNHELISTEEENGIYRFFVKKV